jgi:uncharacterized protein (TIGR02569 family)
VPPPPDEVLAAFGVAGCPVVRLAGGQGTTWRAGEAVLKPAGPGVPGVPELEWLAGEYSQIRGAGFRIARQRRAVTGAVCLDGWSATGYVAGRHAARRWADAIAVGEQLHAALAGLPRPGFLDQRDSPWDTGDRVAWGEIPAARFARVRHIRQLAAAIRPVTAPSQLIHGDLGGNVLYHDVLPPAVIDFSAYWRPAAFASAIVIADALVWENADTSILPAVSHIHDFGQYLLRALIYRVITESILGKPEPGEQGSRHDPYAAAVHLACQLAA